MPVFIVYVPASMSWSTRSDTMRYLKARVSVSSPASTRFSWIWSTVWPGSMTNLTSVVLGAGRLVQPVAQLGAQEVRDDGHVEDAGVLLEEARDGRADDRPGHDPAADDEPDEQDHDEDEALPGARVGVALARTAQLPALHDADALTAARLRRLRARSLAGFRGDGGTSIQLALDDAGRGLSVDARPPGAAGGGRGRTTRAAAGRPAHARPPPTGW